MGWQGVAVTYVIGQNCHLMLQHADVDAGAYHGFVCPRDGSVREGGVQVNREVVSESTVYTNTSAGTRLWIHFDVICADALSNPDGSEHAETRAEDYARLLEYLAQPAGLQLVTPVGSFSNLGALGFSADERHQPGQSIIKCQLNNAGYYFPPVDPALLDQSIWDGSLTWETAYWR